MKSIRSELTYRLLFGTAVLLIVVSILLCAILRAVVVGEFDSTLQAKAFALATLTDRKDRRIEVDFTAEYMPEFGEEEDDQGDVEKPQDEEDFDDEDEVELEYFEILFQDGSIIAKSPSLGERDLPFPLPLPEEIVFRNLDLPDGSCGRMIQMAFPPRTDEDDEGEEEEEDEVVFVIPQDVDAETSLIVLTVARSRSHLDGLLMSLYATLGVMDLVLLIGMGAIARRAITQGLQPIEAINAQITGIGPEALGERVELESPPRELHTILSALNELLARLERGFARERRFSSDVAHELRTPVAELRTACEVARKWPEDPENVSQFFQDVRDIALQMEKVVTNLLALTRCENGTATVHIEPVPIGPMIKECWDRVSAAAEEKKVTLENGLDPAITVNTDRDKVGMIIQNLVENAVSYSAPESAIHCRLEEDTKEGGVSLSIRNQTEGFAEKDLGHVFDRFWQGDPSRSQQNHSGLGMSIVRSMANLLGIDVDVGIDDGVFRVSLWFPESLDAHGRKVRG